MSLPFPDRPFPDRSPSSAQTEREKRALVALSLVPGIGGGRLRALVARFGRPSAVWQAPRAALMQVPGVGEKTVDAILSFDDRDQVDQQIERAEQMGVSLLAPWEKRFPSRLREIYDPPAYLWMRGTLEPADERALAVVGTRACTDYGRVQARRFAQALVQRGLTVVSGLAYGIDAAAHRGALEAGGRTIAVLGSGLGRIYPQANARLARQAARSGAVLSEFPIDAKPDAPHFPERNRIVSGLSLGTLVIESKSEGGALITARMACEQNREVFAVPGGVGRPTSEGTNRLIQRGHAKLVLTPEDIFEELHLTEEGEPATSAKDGSGAVRAASTRRSLGDLDESARRLYEALSTTPIHIDALCDQTGVAPSKALVTLLELEFEGWVRQLAGKQFRRA